MALDWSRPARAGNSLSARERGARIEWRVDCSDVEVSRGTRRGIRQRKVVASARRLRGLTLTLHSATSVVGEAFHSAPGPRVSERSRRILLDLERCDESSL